MQFMKQGVLEGTIVGVGPLLFPLNRLFPTIQRRG